MIVLVGFLGTSLITFSLDRLLMYWLFDEDISDVRFEPWVYVGRMNHDIRIEVVEPHGGNGTVLIANTSNETIKDVRGTVKYFGWVRGANTDRWTFDFRIGDLPGRGEATFTPPPGAQFSNDGMTYVRIVSESGVAILKDWCSVWDG